MDDGEELGGVYAHLYKPDDDSAYLVRARVKRAARHDSYSKFMGQLQKLSDNVQQEWDSRTMLGLEEAEAQLDAHLKSWRSPLLTNESKEERRSVRLAELVARAANLKDVPRLALGILPAIDEALGGGTMPGHSVFIGGFTGSGKTTATTRVAASFAERGHPVLLIPLELSAVEAAARFADALPPLKLPTSVDVEVWDGGSELSALVGEIERWANARKGWERCGVVVLDYLQRVQSEGNAQNRERQIGVATETLSRLARKLGFVLVCAAQLNRLSQTTGPALETFRESGTIEQAADVAIMLAPSTPGRVQLHILKHRWGQLPVTEFEAEVDYKACRYVPIHPASKWDDLAQRVIEFVGKGKSRRIREVTAGVRFGNGHASRRNLEEAADATGLFAVIGTKIEVFADNADNVLTVDRQPPQTPHSLSARFADTTLTASPSVASAPRNSTSTASCSDGSALLFEPPPNKLRAEVDRD